MRRTPGSRCRDRTDRDKGKVVTHVSLGCGHLVQVMVAGLLEDWLQGFAGERAEDGLGDGLQSPGVGVGASHSQDGGEDSEELHVVLIRLQTENNM